MDALYLPIANSSESIQVAKMYMRALNARALVVENPIGDFRLYKNDEIADAHDPGGDDRLMVLASSGQGVKDLRRHHMAARITIGPGAPFPEVPELNFQLQALVDKLLKDTDFGLLARVEGFSPFTIGLVLSRSEGGTHNILTAKLACRCTRDKSHHKQGPPPHHGDKCKTCSGTYDCV